VAHREIHVGILCKETRLNACHTQEKIKRLESERFQALEEGARLRKQVEQLHKELESYKSQEVKGVAQYAAAAAYFYSMMLGELWCPCGRAHNRKTSRMRHVWLTSGF